jgi:hypothetical protein
MGFYYGSSSPEPEKEPGGCMEVLIITRVAFTTLFMPLAVLFGAVIALVLLFVTFSYHWLAGVLYLLLIGAGIAWYARWEQGHFRNGPPM